MHINELKNFNICNYLLKSNSFNLNEIVQKILELELLDNIFLKIDKIEQKKESPNLSYIIDLEGDPYYMAGFLIGANLFQLYIKDIINRKILIIQTFEILKILKNAKMIPFCFSNFEQDQLNACLNFLKFQSYNTDSYDFIKDFYIVNLQGSSHESLIEGLFKIGIPNSDDILFRDHKLLYKLHRIGEYELILRHNQNCLQKENLLLIKRWIKKFKV